MNYIKVTTPDNIEVEYRLAGAGSRIAAALIDSVIQMTVFIIVIIAAFFIAFNDGITSIIYNNYAASLFLTFIIITYFIIFFGYFLICEIIMKGQTIGKKILKLRTIRQNGQPITFVQSIIRNLIRTFIDNQGVGIITIVFSKNNKRLGDMAAGTIVISENPDRVRSETILYNDYLRKSTEVFINVPYPLDFNEFQLIKEYFARKQNFTDGGKGAFNSIAQHLSSKFALPRESITEEFLLQILNDNNNGFGI